MIAREAVAASIELLAAVPAPSGAEGAIDALLDVRLRAFGATRSDPAGNRVLRIAGRGERPAVAIAAHKDEISVVVKRVEDDGRLVVRALGDTHPWVWGEGHVEALGDLASVPGVLSFGARHVSAESSQRRQVDGAGLAWSDAWVETKRTPDDLRAAGVRPGTPCVLAASRRTPTRLGDDAAWLAAPALDDRVAVAALLLLAARLQTATPAGDVELVFTSREEIGAHGAQYWSRHAQIDDVVALDVCPVAAEYAVVGDARPVILEGDSTGLLTPSLGRELVAAAERAGVALQHGLIDRYRSDASALLATGLVARAACLGVPTDNTHGLEIVHLDAVAACVEVLAAWVA